MGLPGALRAYALSDPKRRSRVLANPMAAKIGQGAGDYDDQTNWSFFLMTDWQGGVGKKDPTAGGFLYAQAETRYPNRLTLPMALQGTLTYMPGLRPRYATDLMIGGSQTYAALAKRVDLPICNTTHVYLWLKNNDDCDSVTVSLYADAGTKPTGAALATATIELSGDPGYGLYHAALSYAVAAPAAYHIAFAPTTTGQAMSVARAVVPAGSNYSAYATVAATWSADTVEAGFLFDLQVEYSTSPMTSIVYFSGGPRVAMGSSLYNGFDLSSSVLAGPGTITDVIKLGSTLWVAYGTAGNVNTTTDGFTAIPGAVQANKFAKWKGLLWRSLGANLYYTADGVAWSGPFEIADTGEQIRALAGQGDYLYVATDSQMMYFGFGDQALSVMPWATTDASNGVGMQNYQGSLYVPIGESLLKFEGGSFLPIGLDLGEGLPETRSGVVTAMVQQNNWLIVAIDATASGGVSTLWAYNNQGWHNIAALPAGVSCTALGYDRSSKYMYIGTDKSSFFYMKIDDVAKPNNSVDNGYAYTPFAWLETDWFYGGLREIAKDFESVYVDGEEIDSSNYVEIYWQDDGSTAWELLGTVTSNTAEMRWSDPSTRPNSKRIKIGVGLYSNGVRQRPTVRAVRVKFMSMVMDRWRWTLPVAVSDRQQFPDGSINPRNMSDQRAHLDMLIKSVAPFLLYDTDDVGYEVKCLAASDQVVEWEPNPSGQALVKYEYALTLEQTTTGIYSG